MLAAAQFSRKLTAVRFGAPQRGYCAPTTTTVPIDLIKQLRTKTKAGISDCRAALAEASLDLAKAEEILQKKAKVVAEKKSTRIAAEGLVAAVTDVTNKKLAVVEVRSYSSLGSPHWPSYGFNPLLGAPGAMELLTESFFVLCNVESSFARLISHPALPLSDKRL